MPTFFISEENGKLKVNGCNLRPLSTYGLDDYAECYVEEYLDSQRREKSNQERVLYNRKDVPAWWEKYTVIFEMHSAKKTGGCAFFLTVAKLTKDGYICEDEAPTLEEQLLDVRKELARAEKEIQRLKDANKLAQNNICDLKSDLERLKNRGFWARVFNK